MNIHVNDVFQSSRHISLILFNDESCFEIK